MIRWHNHDMIIISSAKRTMIKTHVISVSLSTWRILYEVDVSDLYWYLSSHSPFCVRSDVNNTHYTLRDDIHVRTYVHLLLVQCSLSHVHSCPTKNTCYKHFTFYEASRGKQDISPFTRSVREIRHSQRGRRNSWRSKHNYHSTWGIKKVVTLFRSQGKYLRIILL